MLSNEFIEKEKINFGSVHSFNKLLNDGRDLRWITANESQMVTDKSVQFDTFCHGLLSIRC